MACVSQLQVVRDDMGERKGIIKFRPAPNASGMSTFKVTLVDSGGTGTCRSLLPNLISTNCIDPPDVGSLVSRMATLFVQKLNLPVYLAGDEECVSRM
jgi:hypothetical protein